MKKIIAFILVSVMLFALAPVAVFAQHYTNIKNIVVDDVVIYEYTFGGGETEWAYDGTYLGSWYNYHIQPNEVTVVYDDNTTDSFSSPYQCWSVTGSSWNVYTDQSYYSQWGVGTHEATISIGSKSAAFNVIIVEGTLKSLEVENTNVTEMCSGYMTAGYNNVTGNVEDYCRYGYYSPAITGTYKDGTKVDATNGIELNGEVLWPSYADTQSVYDKWGVGEHVVTAYLLGAKCTFKVYVKPSPIDHIVFHDLTLIKGVNSFKSGGKTKYDYRASYTVYMKNGTHIDSEGGRFEYDDIFMYGYCDDNQQYVEWQPGGTYDVTVNLGAYTGSFKVKIIDNPYKQMDIFEGEDTNLYIKFVKYDNTYVSKKIKSFSSFGYDEGMIRALIILDDQEYTAYFDCMKDADGRFILEKYVYLVLGEMTSNTLVDCDWVKRSFLLPRFAHNTYTYRTYAPEFRGLTQTDYRVDDIVTLACNIRDMFSIREAPVFSNGNKMWAYLDTADVVETVKYIFGVDVDITKYSYYDPSAPAKVAVAITSSTEYLDWTYLTPEGLDWYYMAHFMNGEGEECTIDFHTNRHFVLKSIEFIGLPLLYKKGDINGDGIVSMKDVLLLRKYLANIETLTDEQWARADVTGDGLVTMKDVLKLRKYLANIETLD